MRGRPSLADGCCCQLEPLDHLHSFSHGLHSASQISVEPPAQAAGASLGVAGSEVRKRNVLGGARRWATCPCLTCGGSRQTGWCLTVAQSTRSPLWPALPGLGVSPCRPGCLGLVLPCFAVEERRRRALSGNVGPGVAGTPAQQMPLRLSSSPASSAASALARPDRAGRLAVTRAGLARWRCPSAPLCCCKTRRASPGTRCCSTTCRPQSRWGSGGEGAEGRGGEGFCLFFPHPPLLQA